MTPDSFPTVVWQSISAGTRAQGDGLDDRAAIYHKDNNIILANADFQGFSDLIDFFAGEYSHVPNCDSAITQSVQEAFEQNLTEVVTGALSLEGRPQWQPTQIENALSTEALTAATMPRFHTINQIRRQLGSKLGKVLDKEQ